MSTMNPYVIKKNQYGADLEIRDRESGDKCGAILRIGDYANLRWRGYDLAGFSIETPTKLNRSQAAQAVHSCWMANNEAR